MPAGRPTDYTPELAERICEAIASTPRGIQHLCREQDDFPHFSTVFRWINDRADFREMYARAREQQGDLCAYQSAEDLDQVDTSADTAREDVSLAREKSKTKQWMAERLAPRKWGARQILSGDEDAPLDLRHLVEKHGGDE